MNEAPASSSTFKMEKDTFDAIKRRPNSIKDFSFAYGVPEKTLKDAFTAYEAVEATRIAREAVSGRIAAKDAKFNEYNKTLTGFTVPESLVTILNRARALSTELSDKDGSYPITIGFSYDEKNNRWNLTAEGENRETKQAGTKGRVSYDYFYAGQAIEGRLSDWLKSQHPNSAAAKATANGVNAWTAVQVDPALSNLVTRSTR